eukprot:TRINITY_DN22959_c0_g2_i1.p1 TRINITY_DN22959_c0_g2~~TRINITY_DN22959_c0_g2_i1.p1  ORF type:complete len:2231 (+),score=367.58 TRINITY_DN22959_c0_g2_i1:34-6693(+)
MAAPVAPVAPSALARAQTLLGTASPAVPVGLRELAASSVGSASSSAADVAAATRPGAVSPAVPADLRALAASSFGSVSSSASVAVAAVSTLPGAALRAGAVGYWSHAASSVGNAHIAASVAGAAVATLPGVASLAGPDGSRSRTSSSVGNAHIAASVVGSAVATLPAAALTGGPSGSRSHAASSVGNAHSAAFAAGAAVATLTSATSPAAQVSSRALPAPGVGAASSSTFAVRGELATPPGAPSLVARDDSHALGVSSAGSASGGANFVAGAADGHACGGRPPVAAAHAPFSAQPPTTTPLQAQAQQLNVAAAAAHAPRIADSLETSDGPPPPAEPTAAGPSSSSSAPAQGSAAAASAAAPNAAIAAQGLPEAIVRSYAARGLKELYPWQAECLVADGVADGRNLVYCAPTSGGKTLVSEILMLRRVLTLKNRAIFVLPYVSIVTEKMRYLQELCRSTRTSIKGFYGGSAEGIREDFDIAVCTIEKANALVNYLLEEGTLAETLGTFVVDELHLVGDRSRGYLLEVTLSKVLYLAKNVQVVGMSATLPNVDVVARWLNATLYQTSYRPVPLQEYILVNGQLMDPAGGTERALDLEGLSESAKKADASSGVVATTWEVTQHGHSALVFCSSKAKCEKCADFLAEWLPESPGEAARRTEREAMVQQLQRQATGTDPTLAKTLLRGVAFHHSGLTTEERAIVERGYSAGSIVVICATSTLAAGVNLPARRVIFQTPYMGNAFLDATQYKQMAGRAGRAGQGVLGESVLIAPAKAKRQAFELVAQQLPKVSSCLRSEERGLKRLLLEVLSVTALGKGEELINFCGSTLLAAQKAAEDSQLTGDPMKDYPEIADAMQWLLAEDMVRLDERNGSYYVTPLGRAVSASGLEPQQGLLLFHELERARPCISLDSDLHICFLVTPPDGNITVDWKIFNRVLGYLSTAERRVVDRVGVRLDLVSKAAFQGGLPNNVLSSLDGMRLARFYSSLVLWAVLHETPPQQLLQRFSIGRGQLQQLQQASASFTTIVAVFCNKLQWHLMEALILSFRQRLAFGVRNELVPLMQIPDMNCTVARILYEHGFTTPLGIAGARNPEILRVLRKTLPPDMPSSALPEANAQRLIDAAKVVSKEAAKEKRRKARDARKELGEGSAAKRPRLMSQGAGATSSSSRQGTSFQLNRGDAQASGSTSLGPQTAQHLSATVPTVDSRASAWANALGSAGVQRLQLRTATATSITRRPPSGPQSNVAEQPVSNASSASHAAIAPANGSSARSAVTSISSNSGSNLTVDSAESSDSLRNFLAPIPEASSERNSSPPRAFSQNVGGAHPYDSQCTPATPAFDSRLNMSPVDEAVATCATPCRSADFVGLSPENHVSSERLSEGLRRIGRRSLTPRDVEAVNVSPQSEGADAATRRQRRGSGAVRSQPSPMSSASAPAARDLHVGWQAEAEFLGSTIAAASVIQGDGALSRPPLYVLHPGDDEAHRHLAARLHACSWAGVAVVASAIAGAGVLCFTLSREEAFCVIFTANLRPSLFDICRWFSDERHLCLAPDAKELAGALLQLGVDVRCALAEPRIAMWLLDPDDKQPATTSDIAALLGVRLRPPVEGPTLRGSGVVALDAQLKAQLSTSGWQDAFLTLPATALLLQRLKSQQLLESFWHVEMPFVTVLAWMEHVGIACQTRDPTQTQSHILYKIAALQERVREVVGRRVLLSSSEDVGRALFEDLQLPVPNGIRFKRKNNGRFAYRSPMEVLKQVQAHPVVEHVMEHRQLNHVARRFEALFRGGFPPRHEPLCQSCRAQGRMHVGGSVSSGADGGQVPQPLPRLRPEFVQTATATGRIATAPGSVPLLHLENSFEVREVWRPSVADELSAGRQPDLGVRVFAAVASESPPRPRHLREGLLESLLTSTCADPIPGGEQTLAAYWISHGWTAYAVNDYARSVRQVQVRHGSSVLSYPADRVWRLAAPIRIADDTPTFLVNPRQLLVADAGRVLLSVDYSQLEVRLMAHFSQDERFVRILQGEGDVFRHVAAGWLQKPEAEVSAEERSGAKRICYGLIYGIGSARLAVELGISAAQAREFQASFMRKYAGVSAWVQSCRDQARQCGFVETLHGRRRFLPALAARQRAERQHAERQAVNTSCQASAADLVKTAMVGIHAKLRDWRSHADGGCRTVAHMLLQIHDELLFEVDEAHLEAVREIVVAEMIGAGRDLRVPLRVTWRVGRSWGSLQ